VADIEAERLLEQALRAQAAGVAARGPVAGYPPPPPLTAPPPPPTQPPPPADEERSSLSAGWVLVIALVLGLLAGAVAGLVTVL
jgi:hypothetical protein